MDAPQSKATRQMVVFFTLFLQVYFYQFGHFSRYLLLLPIDEKKKLVHDFRDFWCFCEKVPREISCFFIAFASSHSPPWKLFFLSQQRIKGVRNRKHRETIFPSNPSSFWREANWFQFFTSHLSLPQSKLANFFHILYFISRFYFYLQNLCKRKKGKFLP